VRKASCTCYPSCAGLAVNHSCHGDCAQAVGFAVLAIGTVVYARGDEGEDHQSAVAADVVRMCRLVIHCF